MREHELSRIAMACFVEGIDPSTLAIAPGHLALVEKILAGCGADSGTDDYYRCLNALSSESQQDAQ